jgi:glycosyltransferase involved in cell wall biosynthesis
MSFDLPKVLFCAFDVVPAPTGFSARATEFIRALNRDFIVDALTAKSPDQSHIERYHGARLMRVPVGSGDLPQRGQAFQRAVRRQLESDEYQLVQFTDPYGGYALCEARAQYGFKLVYDASTFPSSDVRHTHPHLEGDPRFLAKLRRQELFCLMNADAILVSSSVAADYVASLGIDRTRITVIRSTADPGLFPREQMDRPDRQPMRLVYLGSQVTWQGLPLLLKAVAAAIQSVEVRLAIVGQRNTSWRLQLEEMVRELKLIGKVEFGNPVSHDQLAPLLKSADVGVAPLLPLERNLVQGASLNKVAHYLAAGRPVIASDLPVCHEYLDDTCALFPKPADENDFARRISELARDPARRIAMGEAARVKADRNLHAQDPRRTLTALYLSLIEMPVKPASSAEFNDARGSSKVGSEPTSLVPMGDPPTDMLRAGAASDTRTDETRIPLEEPLTEIRAVEDRVTDPRLSVERPSADEPLPLVKGQLIEDSSVATNMPIVTGQPIDDGLEADLSSLITPSGVQPQTPVPRQVLKASNPSIPVSSAQPPSAVTPDAGPRTLPSSGRSPVPQIASGVPPPVVDEWVGNILFGYAPPIDGRPAASIDPAGSKPRIRRGGVTEDSTTGVKP